MFTWFFWRDALERAIRTFAETAVAMLGVGVGFGAINWATVASVAGVAAIVSILTSVAATRRGSEVTASLLKEDSRGKHEA